MGAGFWYGCRVLVWLQNLGVGVGSQRGCEVSAWVRGLSMGAGSWHGCGVLAWLRGLGVDAALGQVPSPLSSLPAADGVPELHHLPLGVDVVDGVHGGGGAGLWDG